MYLVDTNILIYYINNEIPEKSLIKINNILQNHFNISIISKIEFLGFRKHTHESYLKSTKFLEYANIIRINDNLVDLVIDLKREKNIRLADAIIAATSIQNNFTLITRNVKDFIDIELKIFNPFDLNDE